jgi:hypothetical protein
MTIKDLVLNQLQGSKMLFDSFSKDFNDNDARYQPGNSGNHLNWIFVHMAVSEDAMMSQMSGEPKKLSEALHKAYSGGSTCTADDGMTRAEALKLYNESHARTCEFVKGFPESRFGDKAPEGYPANFPTMATVLGLLGAHPYWHIGQLTVNRTLLKKPKVFG